MDKKTREFFENIFKDKAPAYKESVLRSPISFSLSALFGRSAKGQKKEAEVPKPEAPPPAKIAVPKTEAPKVEVPKPELHRELMKVEPSDKK